MLAMLARYSVNSYNNWECQPVPETMLSRVLLYNLWLNIFPDFNLNVKFCIFLCRRNLVQWQTTWTRKLIAFIASGFLHGGERLQNMLGDSNLTGFVGLLLNRQEEKYNLEGGVPWSQIVGINSSSYCLTPNLMYCWVFQNKASIRSLMRHCKFGSRVCI